MNSDVIALLAEANPVPEPATDAPALDALAYLALLEERSSTMTMLDIEPRTEPPRRRPPWTVAAAAAVAVLVIGVAIALANRGNDPEPPATTTSTTTTTAPTTTTVADSTTTTTAVSRGEAQAGLAISIAYLEAAANGDVASIEELAIEGQVQGFIAGSFETLRSEMAWREAVGWTVVPDECSVADPSPVNTRIQCSVTHQLSWATALEAGPFEGEYFLRVHHPGDRYVGRDITITTVTEVVTRITDEQRVLEEAWLPFLAWLDEQYPESVDAMLNDQLTLPYWFGETQPVPRLSPESIELWRQYTEEFVAEFGS